MFDILISWLLPTTRESGAPLDPATIAFTEVEMTANGVDFSPVDSVLPTSSQSVQVNQLDPGSYIVRARTVDIAGRPSAWIQNSFELADNSPPSAPSTLTVTVL